MTISASTTTASTSNSSDGLQFSLGIRLNGGVNITVSVEELNLLGSVNNQTQANQWKYPSESLNPYDNCASNGPVGFTIFQGYYGMNNYSQARSLYLYNTTYLFSCAVNSSPFVYLFTPLSDNISVYLDHQLYYNGTAAVSFATSGYWTSGAGTSLPATFNPFSSGVYTILGADEWGDTVLLHFTVTGSAGTSSSSVTTQTCTPAITVTQGSNSSAQTTDVITLCHSSSYTTLSTESSSISNVLTTAQLAASDSILASSFSYYPPTIPESDSFSMHWSCYVLVVILAVVVAFVILRLRKPNQVS